MSASGTVKLPAGEPPRAGGRIIREASADEAAKWLTLFMSGTITEEDRARWQQWRAAHPDNEQAWQHIEAVSARFKGLHGGAAYRSLSPLPKTPQSGRRKYLAVLLGLGVAGAAGVLGSPSRSLSQLATDMRTGVGERREWTLADGTRLMLNTDSAVDLRFDAQRRLLHLVAGEIRIVTGHASAFADRPFIVQTAEGSVRALGTVFTVRQHDGRTEVAVQDSAVEIVPARAPHAARIMRAGLRTWFSPERIAAPVVATPDSAAWSEGRLVADEVRLADFLDELGRYRHGLLRCDPAVADLRFSGVFPLDDTDRILSMLPSVLPVQVHARTPYWVMVEAAS